MKYFAPLKIRDILSLLGLIVVGFAWVMIDQVFLKQPDQRFMAFTGILIILFYLLFRINKPVKIWHYANTIELILLILGILLTLIIHVLILHDFVSNLAHIVVLWAIIGIMPYFTGLLYTISIKK